MTITDGALQSAAERSSRSIQDRNLPDKAIDLIDEAGARLRIKRLTAPPELKELDARVERNAKEKDQAIKDQEFEKAAELRDTQEKLEAERKEKEQAWREGESDVRMVVDEDVIAQVISQSTGIPVFKLTQAESKKLLGMEAELHKRIIGQDEAVSALSRSIRRTRVGLKDPKRPAGSFIFAGPTGVGKTELAKTLAQFLFDDEDALIRVDMSEFSEKYAASRLFGAPPGYVELHKRIIGQDEAVSALSRSIRRTRVGLKDPKRPAGSFIFAGPTGVGMTELAETLAQFLVDVEDALIRVDMSEFSEKYAASRLFGAPPGYVGYEEGGELTESKVDFKNTIIIVTTNLGTGDIAKAANSCFNLGNNTETSYQRMKDQVSNARKQPVRPEFLNRVDDIVLFKPLTEPEIERIVDLMFNDLRSRLAERQMAVEITEDARRYIATQGYDPVYGARPLRRFIAREVETRIGRALLSGDAG